MDFLLQLLGAQAAQAALPLLFLPAGSLLVPSLLGESQSCHQQAAGLLQEWHPPGWQRAVAIALGMAVGRWSVWAAEIPLLPAGWRGQPQWDAWHQQHLPRHQIPQILGGKGPEGQVRPSLSLSPTPLVPGWGAVVAST